MYRKEPDEAGFLLPLEDHHVCRVVPTSTTLKVKEMTFSKVLPKARLVLRLLDTPASDTTATPRGPGFSIRVR
jgi:hypothetical protein